MYPSFIATLTLCVFPLALPVPTCLLTCSHRPTCQRQTPKSPGLTIPAVAMVTAYVLYAPCLTLVCVASYLIPSSCAHPYTVIPEAMWVMAFAVMSLRLIMDPLLCVLVLRETSKRHHRPAGDTVTPLQLGLLPCHVFRVKDWACWACWLSLLFVVSYSITYFLWHTAVLQTADDLECAISRIVLL